MGIVVFSIDNQRKYSRLGACCTYNGIKDKGCSKTLPRMFSCNG